VLAALGAASLVLPAAGQDVPASPERLIVSGASGQLGGLVVEELLRRGVPAERLILVSRTPDTLQRYATLGAAVRYGDFTEPESLSTAYAGGTRMLLISIGRTRLPRPEAHRNAIEAAVRAGVRHIAYTSWIGISHGETGGLSPDHAATEELLRQSGAQWTMLRNSIYMDGVVAEASGMLASHRINVPENADRITYVTRADCAAAAAAVLATPGHENRAYDITGPAAVGPREIAAAASAVAGVPIEIVATPAGPPSPFGGAAVATPSDDFEALVGRPALSVRAFLEAHRDTLSRTARP
jgi:NAD(P)H dehydrogenase (quinone)